MSKAILILRNEQPVLIEIQGNETTLMWTLSDGTQAELCVLSATSLSLTGDSANYLIATDIEDLDVGQIRRAVEATAA